MRTKQFTFKKRKRVTIVTRHPAISIDLTYEDAKDLSASLRHLNDMLGGPKRNTSLLSPMTHAIWVALDRFVNDVEADGGLPF